MVSFDCPPGAYCMLVLKHWSSPESTLRESRLEAKTNKQISLRAFVLKTLGASLCRVLWKEAKTRDMYLHLGSCADSVKIGVVSMKWTTIDDHCALE